jgi:hypothetical protein
VKEIKAGPSNKALLGTGNEIFRLDDWRLESRTGVHALRGELIGMGSSQRDDHSHIGDDVIMGRGGPHTTPRCTACRWSEIYIFKTVGHPTAERYVVYTLGPSVIPGETTRANVRNASSGFEVVELATVRRGDRGAPFLPAAHARAIAMAASVDDDIAEAYVNRAVA